MDQNKYIELIAQQLSGEISKSDEKLLMEWVASNTENQALWEETKQLWEISDNFDDTFDTDVDAAWTNVEQKIAGTTSSTTKVVDINRTKLNDDSSAKVVGISKFKRLLQYAAVILIAGAGWFWLNQGNADPQLYSYQIGDDQKLEITLPDQSQVVLNENSQLTFQEIDGKRMVNLEGEAWFDVKHLDDVPFEILSGETKTRVLGTAFNVRAYPEEDKIEVSVERGLVAFSENENAKNKTELPAGTEGTFYKKPKTIAKDKRADDNVDAWRTKILIFENTPMSKVYEALERYYEVEIEADSRILNCEYSKGRFENRPLEEILTTIDFALNFQSSIDGKNITITGKGCK